VRAPRFDGCRHCGERLIASPVSELLPERVSPELRHLQAQLAAQLPYRQAAALMGTNEAKQALMTDQQSADRFEAKNSPRAW
jgi:hypothetical protein